VRIASCRNMRMLFLQNVLSTPFFQTSRENKSTLLLALPLHRFLIVMLKKRWKKLFLPILRIYRDALRQDARENAIGKQHSGALSVE
jgi:hypothetical protein